MNDEQILTFLKNTGHLEYPHGEKQVVPSGPFNEAIKTAKGLKAVASFQQFEAELMDRMSLHHHARPARFDGEVGPATIAAMLQPRCGHPDYGPDVEAATGSGSWPNCHGIGDFHCAKVRVNPEGMPTFLKPVFDQVLNRVRAAYRDMGLSYDWVGEESTFHNTSINFVPRSNGWIGLAIVGQRESCSSKIWARFLATYKPNNVLNEWTTLIMHELGHNAGLHHSRGGVMNPSIVQGLAPTWRGDPSESILANYYGGEPIPGDNTPPTGKEFWTHQGLKSNKGQILWIPLSAPFPVGEEQ